MEIGEKIAIGKPIMASTEKNNEERAKNVKCHNRKRRHGSMAKLVRIVGRMGKKRHKVKHKGSVCGVDKLEESGESEVRAANEELPEEKEVVTGIEQEQLVTVDSSERCNNRLQCSNKWINQAQEKAMNSDSNHRDGGDDNCSNHSDSSDDDDDESDNNSEVGNGDHGNDNEDSDDDDDNEDSDDDGDVLGSSAGSRSSCIIRVTLQCCTGYPLGFEIEGGSDTPLKYICIKSIVPNSPAFESGCFRKGDQLVMIGAACLIGVTFEEAQYILRRTREVVKVIAQRKVPLMRDTSLKCTSPRDGTPPKVVFPSIPVSPTDSPPKEGGSAKQGTSHIHTNSSEQGTPPCKQDACIRSSPTHMSKHGVNFRSSSNHLPGMRMEVEMRCDPGEFFGIVIIGGKDDPYLKNIHVRLHGRGTLSSYKGA